MIKNKVDLEEYLKRDKEALFMSQNISMFERLTNSIYHFEIVLRKCEYYRNTKNNPYLSIPYIFYKLVLRKLSYKLGFSISENVFGPGLSIAHYGCIVVNPHAKIGENCRIHSGVNIGANKSDTDVPIIGNNVYIGPGAKIFGDITIGDNCKIGANAVVNHSFESNCIIAGIPATIIRKE